MKIVSNAAQLYVVPDSAWTVKAALAGPFPNTTDGREAAALTVLQAQLKRLSPGQRVLYEEAVELAGGEHANVWQLLGVCQLIERKRCSRAYVLKCAQPVPRA